MSYTCKLYKNTGFNTLNIPGTKAVLEMADPNPIVTEALEIVQNRVMGSVRVAVSSFNQVRDVDYIEVGDFFYYAPGGPVMTSDDVATFALVPNFFLSVGGTDALARQDATLSIADGITSRVHVPKSTDTFGAYTEDDPLMTPAKPLELTTYWHNCELSSEPKSKTFIETTVELPSTAASISGSSYVDSNNGYSVTIPEMKAIDENSTICKYKITEPLTHTVISENSSPKTILYDLDDASVGPPIGGVTPLDAASANQKGIARVRELGVESCIINQVQMPLFFVQVDSRTVRSVPRGQSGYCYTESQIDYLSGLTGELFASMNGLDYIPKYSGYTIKNNRVTYGSMTKYGLMTASGATAEFNAEDIYEAGETAPHILYCADPRPTGSPYFRFKSVNRDDVHSDTFSPSFFRNCVQGLPWKQVPLIWTQASGSQINTMKFDNETKVATAQYAGTKPGMFEGITRQSYSYPHTEDLDRITSERAHDANKYFTGLEDFVNNSSLYQKMDLLTGGYPFKFGSRAIAGAVDGLRSVYLSPFDSILGAPKHQMTAEREAALASLGVQNMIVAPTVNFPYNAELIRDFFGNGVLEYRYNYNVADLMRVDKILTMYGYKHTKALEPSDFVNRRYFNYIECNNVSLTGDYPKWFLDGIADELKAGIRIWHEPINTAHYLDNPDA